MAKRDCFPTCPPPQLVTVERKCNLPVMPELPDVVLVPSGIDCPEPLMCIDAANAKLLALRESRMKLWIKESLAACGQKLSTITPKPQPASKPASVPAPAPSK
jgi:hypothetical protein